MQTASGHRADDSSAALHGRLGALERENAELRGRLCSSVRGKSSKPECRPEPPDAAALHTDPALIGQLTDAMPAMIAYVDRHERYRFVNKAYEEWFGRSRETIVGRTVREMLGSEAYAVRSPCIQAALRGELARFEGPTPHRDGTSRDTEMQYVPHAEMRTRDRRFFRAGDRHHRGPRSSRPRPTPL